MCAFQERCTLIELSLDARRKMCHSNRSHFGIAHCYVIIVAILFVLQLNGHDEVDNDWLTYLPHSPHIQIPITTGHPYKDYMNAMIESLQFSPDGKQIITADRTGQVCYWNLETKKLDKAVKYKIDSAVLPKREARIGTVYSQSTVICRLSPHSRYLLREVFADRLFLFDIATGTHKELPLGKGWQQVGHIADLFSPDDTLLLLELWPQRMEDMIKRKTRRFQLWETATGKLRWDITLNQPNASSSMFAVFRADNQTLQIKQQTRNLVTGERLADVAISDRYLEWVVSPDRRSLLVDGPREIDLSDGVIRHAPSIDDGSNYKRSPVDFRLLALADNRTSMLARVSTRTSKEPIRIAWCEWPTGKLRAMLSYPKATTVQHEKVSEDGNWLACVAPDQALILAWNLQDRPHQGGKARVDTEREKDWVLLASGSGVQAWHAMYRMLAEPAESVQLLRQRMTDNSSTEKSEQQRMCRAIELLGMIDSKESRELLQEWSVAQQPEGLRELVRQQLTEKRKTIILPPSQRLR